MTIVVTTPIGPPAAAIQPNPLAADTPHFAFPVRFGRNFDGSVSTATVEQDTLDETLACVKAIVACPIGFRDELPPFGVPLPEFAQAPVDASGLQQAISMWEPRVDAGALEMADKRSDAWRHVLLAISNPGAANDQSGAPPRVPPATSDRSTAFPSSSLFPGSHVLP